MENDRRQRHHPGIPSRPSQPLVLRSLRSQASPPSRMKETGQQHKLVVARLVPSLGLAASSTFLDKASSLGYRPQNPNAGDPACIRRCLAASPLVPDTPEPQQRRCRHCPAHQATATHKAAANWCSDARLINQPAIRESIRRQLPQEASQAPGTEAKFGVQLMGAALCTL